jgi:hypothetical protein
MEIELPDDITRKASKCEKNFRCLSGESDKLCRVLCFIKEDIYFVKCMDDPDCLYMESFEKTRLCNCPVRKEIYKKYKV